MSKPSLMRAALVSALLFMGTTALGQNANPPPNPNASQSGGSGAAPGSSMSQGGSGGSSPATAPDSGIGARNPPNTRSVRIVTWNVHPTTVGGETPEQRMGRLIRFARTQGVAIIALQEVPRSLFTYQSRLAQLSTDVTGAGYELLAVQTEYPPNLPAGRSPTSVRQNAYVVIYDPNVVTPRTTPPDPHNALGFADMEAFTEGPMLQGRPPSLMQFNVHHPNDPDSVLNLLNWHNEAGTFARAHVGQLEDYIENRLEPRRRDNGEDWAVVGDFNVEDSTQELRNIDNAQNVLTHADGIDHIVTNARLENIINDDPGLNIDPNFRSTGRHLALFGEMFLSAPRP